MDLVVRVLRSFAAVLITVIALGASPAAANSKYAAFVIHADSGDVLFNKYSNKRLYPASLTKMMTLYLLFDELEAGRLTLDSELKVSKRAAGQPPSKLGVKAGKTIDVETAIHALTVKSANDVAVVIAEAIGDTEWQFAKKMTKKARSLGMRRTTFRNASGLPNSKQVTTARDMATLSRSLMHEHTEYFKYFSAKNFVWNGRTYRTHNALVKNFEGSTGLKTGYTRRSGYNLATSVDRDGNRLVGVVLGGRSVRTRDAHMRKILNSAYAAIEKKPTLISSLHRLKPSPRMKPTLLAQLQLEQGAPTIAGNDAIQNEIQLAASEYSADPISPFENVDSIESLIASSSSDDFNEYERVRLSSLVESPDGLVGQGDFEDKSAASWHVQIGAFSSKTMAQAELETAAFAANLIDRARSVVPLIKIDGTTVYRARFTYLEEADATEVCDMVRSVQMSCFVLQEATVVQ